MGRLRIFPSGWVFVLLSMGCSPSQDATHSLEKSHAWIDPFALKGKVIGDGRKDYPKGQQFSALVDRKCEGEGHSTRETSVQSRRIEFDRKMSLQDLETWVEGQPCVVGLSLNQKVRPLEDLSHPNSQEDPYRNQQRHLHSLEVTESYKTFFDRNEGIHEDVVIAVLDTGIALEHPDLKPNLWVNSLEKLGLPGVDDDGNGYIDDVHGFDFGDNVGDPSHKTINDHGTHVAGLAAAVVSNHSGGQGVMGRNAKIMALNVFGRSWGSDTVDMDEAIRYAADNGANVLNISVGGEGVSETTASALVYALNKGVFIVVAAGNEGINIDRTFYFPASYAREYSGVVAVGALDLETSELCGFSNFGARGVEIAAPGCDRLAPRQGLFSTRSRGRYGHKKGTSMAAPLVSGAAALAFGFLREHRSQAPRPDELEVRMLRAAVQNSHLEGQVSNARSLNLRSLAQRVLDELF